MFFIPRRIAAPSFQAFPVSTVIGLFSRLLPLVLPVPACNRHLLKGLPLSSATRLPTFCQGVYAKISATVDSDWKIETLRSQRQSLLSAWP